MVLEKTLESPLDYKKIQPVHPKGNQFWVFIGGLMLKLKLHTLATWCKGLTHLKRPWCWEALRAGGEGDNSKWHGWMASPTQQTWVWVDSRSCDGQGAWHAAVHGVAKSRTRLSGWTELNTNINWVLIMCQVQYIIYTLSDLFLHNTIYLFSLTAFYRCVNWSFNKLTVCPKITKLVSEKLEFHPGLTWEHFP